MIEKIRGDQGHSSIGKFNEIIDVVNKLNEKIEEWKEGDTYYFIQSYGDGCEDIYTSSNIGRQRKDFMGIYRTAEEAVLVRDKIREFVKTLQ